MNDSDSNYILDKIEQREKTSLNGMRLLIVAIYGIDDNNHYSILYVVFHYTIIKYQHVNIIWILIFFSVFSILIYSVMFILLKDELFPKFI